MIRLLISYGADEKRVPAFTNWKARVYAKELTVKVVARNQTQERVERILAENGKKPTREIIGGYESIGQYWHDLLAEEKQEGEGDTPSIILEHYRAKGDFYYNKARELRELLDRQQETNVSQSSTTFLPLFNNHHYNGMRYRGRVEKESPYPQSVEMNSLSSGGYG